MMTMTALQRQELHPMCLTERWLCRPTSTRLLSTSRISLTAAVVISPLSPRQSPGSLATVACSTVTSAERELTRERDLQNHIGRAQDSVNCQLILLITNIGGGKHPPSWGRSRCANVNKLNFPVRQTYAL